MNYNNFGLSNKQLRILEFAAKGYKADYITFRLNISSNTVKYHKKKIFDKLNVCTMTEAISVAYVQQLFEDYPKV